MSIQWNKHAHAVQLRNRDWNAWLTTSHDQELGSGFRSVRWRDSHAWGPIATKPMINNEVFLSKKHDHSTYHQMPSWLEETETNAKHKVRIHTYIDSKRSALVRTIQPLHDFISANISLAWRIELSRKNMELILPNHAPYDAQTNLPATETPFVIVRTYQDQNNTTTPKSAHLIFASRQGLVCNTIDERIFIETKSSYKEAEFFIAFADTSSDAIKLGAELTGEKLAQKNKILLDVRDSISHQKIPARILVEAHSKESTLGPLILDPTRSFETEALFIDATFPRNELELPAGNYTFRATRGIGWSIDQKTIEIQNNDSLRVSFNLVEEVKKEGWIGCDLHVHAKGSFDARQVTYEDRVRSLVAVGVDCAAATEHNHIGDYGPVVQSQGFSNHLLTLPGVELTTASYGHFNVYPWRKDAAVPVRKLSNLRALFDEVRSLHKGHEHVLQLNHPRMRNDDGSSIGYLELAGINAKTGAAYNGKVSYLHDYDAIEIFNGYQLGNLDEVRTLVHEWLHMLDRGDVHVATGSSDSHAFTFPWAGFPRTFINVGPHWKQEEHASDVLIRALKQGKAFVTSGPIVFVHVGQASFADRVQARDHKVRIEVQLTSWQHSPTLDLYVGTQLLKHVEMQSIGSTNSYQLEVSLASVVRKKSLVAVVEAQLHDVARGLTGMKKTMAITNPIWLMP